MRRLLLRRSSAILALGIIGAGAIACSASRTGERRAPITGVVTETFTPVHRITLAHDAVDGIMPAMTMTFAVAQPAPRLAAGDRIRATVVMGSDASRLEDVSIASHASGPVLALPASVPLPADGSVVTWVPLQDQNGRRVLASDLAGHMVIATFIYTRCPLPEYCPATMRRLVAIERAIERMPDVRARTRVLAITLDPVNDTPAVLREYGAALLRGPRPFDGVSLLTGRPDDISRLATSLGVAMTGAGAGVITHTSPAVVVGLDGRVARAFGTNDWQAADVVAVLSKLVQASRAGVPATAGPDH